MTGLVRGFTAMTAALFAGALSAPPSGYAIEQSSLFSKARAAIGGRALADLRGLTLSGSLRVSNGWYQVRPGPQFIDSTLEMKVLFPDRYRRSQAMTVPGGPTFRPVVRGFVGNSSLGGALDLTQREFARLMLVFFLETRTPLQLNLTGSNHSTGLEFGADGLTYVVDLDPATLVPTDVRATVRREGRDTEEIMTVLERRDVGGIKVPVHVNVKTTASGKLIEEYKFSAVRLHPPPSPGEFQ